MWYEFSEIQNTGVDVEPVNAVSVAALAQRIHLVRGHRVMLDADLATLYGVTTKRLNEQIKRNRDRFPADFMFQLTASEETALRSQIATSNASRGGRRYSPYAFTEHGAIMAATVLNSPSAVQMSIFVVRAFVQLRDLLSANKALATKLSELERKLSGHDNAIAEIIEAIRKLMTQPVPQKRGIGFTADIK